MRTLARCVVSIGAAVILLAGCGGTQPPIAAPSGVAQTSHTVTPAAPYQIVHSFGYLPDGQGPEAALIAVNGTLYGTTGGGGTFGSGTVFSLNPTTEKETVLHSFDSTCACDGNHPTDRLIDLAGTLYGTTLFGGNIGFGTVFSLNLTTGVEKQLYSFGAGSEGGDPDGGLIDVAGTLYGTTGGGGTYGGGTMFSIGTDGTGFETVHSFGRGSDGKNPAGLVNVKGTLYGTTFKGGKKGRGTVYSISTSGIEKVLHSFLGGPQGGSHDGAYPAGGLLSVKGAFYGMTVYGGGAGSCGRGYGGCGTVFSISTTGAEKVLHSFGMGSDGVKPTGVLILGDTLYGATTDGGKYGKGVIFSLNPTTGVETVLHTFGGGSDGTRPFAGLINVDGTLYGTTLVGGKYNRGTIFSLTL